MAIGAEFDSDLNVRVFYWRNGMKTTIGKVVRGCSRNMWNFNMSDLELCDYKRLRACKMLYDEVDDCHGIAYEVFSTINNWCDDSIEFEKFYDTFYISMIFHHIHREYFNWYLSRN